jgi:hypothetical protein
VLKILIPIKQQDSKYFCHLAKSPPLHDSGLIEDEEEEYLDHARLPVIPLAAAVDDTPDNVKITYKGK